MLLTTSIESTAMESSIPSSSATGPFRSETRPPARAPEFAIALFSSPMGSSSVAIAKLIFVDPASKKTLAIRLSILKSSAPCAKEDAVKASSRPDFLRALRSTFKPSPMLTWSAESGGQAMVVVVEKAFVVVEVMVLVVVVVVVVSVVVEVVLGQETRLYKQHQALFSSDQETRQSATKKLQSYAQPMLKFSQHRIFLLSLHSVCSLQ
mmetsp:Transcript_118908/g.337131  ORF Transcript_118908/g.337131 Transcript_118908/m.337131 type:complete len:208 (+) Transcript_118908:299-922(+)